MYIPLLIFLIVAIFFALGGIAVSMLVAPHTTSHPQKNLPYECGITTKKGIWQSLSISYFRYALLFILFDIEMVLLIPLLLVAQNATWLIVGEIIFFVAMLGGGLVYAWKKGFLHWDEETLS